MSFAPSDFKFSLAVGVAGAYVDVTTDVLWDNSVTRSWGTQNQFIPVSPGVYQFTLDNRTGKYASDNPNSTLATLLGEGTGCCWSLNGQLRSGQVRALQPIFTDIGVPEASAQMRVTVTDMLGVAALNTLGNLAYSQVMGSNPYAFWPLNDDVGSGQAAEVTGNGTPLVASGSVTAVFGVPGPSATNETQMQLTLAPTTLGGILEFAASGVVPSNPPGVIGYLGAWVLPPEANADAITIIISGAGNLSIVFAADGTVHATTTGLPGVGPISTTGFQAGTTESYFAAGLTYAGLVVTLTMYMNGAAVAAVTGTATSISIPSPNFYRINILQGAGPGNDSITLAHLSYGPVLVREEAAGITTEADRLIAITQTTQLVTLGTLPTDLSTAPVGYAATSGQSAFDALNAAVLTEQGYIDTVTTGTLLAPVQSIRIRARERPVTPAATFAVAVDLQGAPTFARALNDEISLEKVTGADGTSQAYSNTSLITRVGSANGSDTILTFAQTDLYEWASDRVWRGIKRFTDITSITLDARGGSGSSLWNTLTSLAPGDRISITGLPSDQLGYATWDGWLIGASENHIDITQSQFTLYLQPCTPATAIWDTDLWANGGNNTISTALTSGATSMLCTSADVVTLFETAAMNYYLQVDSEVVKVTACSAPVAGVQTLTITRAQFSTTAAAHAVGTAPEVYADSTGRLNNGIWAF